MCIDQNESKMKIFPKAEILLLLLTIDVIELKLSHDKRKVFVIEVVDDTLPEKTVVLDEIQTECSATCGEGVRTVRRVGCKKSCFPECCERNVEEFPCFKEECQIPYGSWSSWSSCTVPCIKSEKEKSVKIRTRRQLQCFDVDGCGEEKFGNVYSSIPCLP